jgi:endogenous inhibitor of DNA gyrase (YacG/DUF329 family)
MILRNATIKYKGYDPSLLKPKSNKRICYSCDECGRVRYTTYNNYNRSGNLCNGCSCIKPKITLTCQQCGDEFKVIQSRKNQRYCSKQCKDDWMSGNSSPHYKQIIKICKQCNKKYQIKPSKKDKSNFCSNKCKGEWISINKSGENSQSWGKCRELNGNWQGGFDENRPWILPEAQCIKMNDKFNDSEFHHLTKSIGIYIPKLLHKHIWHNLKTSQGMGLMNLLSLQYINGEL